MLWLALMLGVATLLHTVADDWWPATILLFLGRWPWLLTGVPAVSLAVLMLHKRAMLIALAGVAVCVVGIMQFSLGSGRLLDQSAPSAASMRVITFNSNGDAPAPMQLVVLVKDWDPDVLAVQECGLMTGEQLAAIPGYSSDIGRTCVLSKFPILRIDSLRRDNFMAAGGAAWVKRYRLKAPSGEFDFTNVHLDTPRKAFEALMSGRSGATDTIEYKTEVRELESKLARRWVELGAGPSLVAGDFNMPSESAIFRRHWGSLTNGFDHAGFGFGYTRLAGWIQLRIDHVLADEHWTVKNARVLPDYGSDHLPMMVGVELKER